MDDKYSNEVALFRFSVIAPVVNQTFDASSQSEFFRKMAAAEHKLSDGTRAKYSSSAIKKWFLNYRKGGFDALIPKNRNDLGKPRRLNYSAIEKIHAIKEKYPYITGKLVYQKLIEEGYIKASSVSLSTVIRYIRENNLMRSQMAPVERKAFEMEHANDCWQSDASHGPVIKVEGQKKQTYLISFIDDASRLIVHGEFFFNDNAINVQIAFKKAISKYGRPKMLYIDNGPSFRSEQLNLICASLGTVLIYTPPYSPQNKGKIERSYRTIKDGWQNAVDWNEFNSLEMLNTEFNKYLSEKYSNAIHSSIQQTPRSRYLVDMANVKFIAPELLDNHFLHRVERKVNNDATIKLNSRFFEVPQKYIGQKISVRYLPYITSVTEEKAYIFINNRLSETIYPVNKIDNSKIKRNSIDYSRIVGGNSNV